MPLGKLPVLELLAPIMSSMHQWWTRGMDDYLATIPEEKRIYLDASHRSIYVQRAALHEMLIDPAVKGNFIPKEFAKQTALVLRGEDGSPGLSLLLRKAVMAPHGILRTCNSPTQRQEERLNGQATFGDFLTIPVVCYYTLARRSSLLKPVIGQIGLGEETKSGFDWTHTLYRHGKGVVADVVDAQPNLPLIPTAQIRLRKPDQAAERTGDASERTASEGA